MTLAIEDHNFEGDHLWGVALPKKTLHAYCHSERCNKPKFETDSKRIEIKNVRRDAILCPNCHNVLFWERK